MSDGTQALPDRRKQRKTIIVRSLALLVAGVILYFLWPKLIDLFGAMPGLAGIEWYWFAVMAVLMTGAFVAAWELTHIAVPDVPRFVIATSQLVSNAMAKVVPGGAVAAGASYFQMLSVSGVPTGKAAAALAAVSFISNLVLLSLPAIALVLAALSAPIPSGLLPVGVAGGVLFVLMLGGVSVLVKYQKPLAVIGSLAERWVGWFATKLNRDWHVEAKYFVERRDEVVAALGKRWFRALVAAELNWLLDYSVLLVALFAVGADPRPSLVLVAFAGAAVLGMVPITPGGLGIVEVGLSAMLVAAGVPVADATLATLAYRLFQFWLPIPAGAVAYVVFNRKFGRPAELPEQSAS